MSVIYPFFWCPNCGNKITLPFPKAQEPQTCEPRLPDSTWKIDFVCANCDRSGNPRLSEICAGQIRLDRPTQGGRDLILWRERSGSFYRVEFECGFEGCVFPIMAIVYSEHYLTERSAGEIAVRAVPHPCCSNKHPLRMESMLRTSKEIFDLVNC